MSEPLERELRALEVEWPATPDLAGAVLVRLRAEPAPEPARRGLRRRLRAEPARRGLRRRLRPEPARRGLRGRLRPALAWSAAVLVAAFGVTMAASPSARSAVLEWLGLKSVKVERREPAATPAPRSGALGEGLGLGPVTTLAAAERDAGFDVLIPAALGAPDAVRLGGPAGAPRVTLVYRPRRGVTRSAQTGVGLLVTELRATVAPVIEKVLGQGARSERLRIAGGPAYFISGDPHGVAFVDQTGEPVFEEQRLAGSTLLWERSDGMLVRVEGDLSRAAAVRIALSLR